MNVSKRILVSCSVIAASLAAAGTLYSSTRPAPGLEESTSRHDPVVVRATSTFATPTGVAGAASGRDLVVVRPSAAGYSNAALTDEDGAANGFDQITAQPIGSHDFRR